MRRTSHDWRAGRSIYPPQAFAFLDLAPIVPIVPTNQPTRHAPQPGVSSAMTFTADAIAEGEADRASVGAATVSGRLRDQRSRITNGSAFLPGVDGRSAWVRRAKDVQAALTADQGVGDGEDLPEARGLIIRRAAVLEAELERMEAMFAKDAEAGAEPSEKLLDLYQRMSNTQRRLLESVGLDRRAKDVTPNLDDYVRRHAEDVEAVDGP